MASLVAISELRALVGATDPARDGDLVRHLDVATDQLESMTGYVWLAREGYEQVLQVDKNRQIIWSPIAEASGITVEVRSSPSDDWAELTENEDWVAGPGDAIERLGACWERWVKLTVTGGYDEDTTPAAVKNALALQVQFAMERFTAGNIAATGRAVDGAQVTFLGHPDRGFSGQAIHHPEFVRVVEHYRRRLSY